MAKPMQYIKDLEAAGFGRTQAEAQVQMVLDAIEGDLATKADFAVFQERGDGRFAEFAARMDARISQFEDKMDARMSAFEDRMDARMSAFEDKMDTRFVQQEERIQRRFVEYEFRIVTRLGFLFVSTTSIAVAVLTWLIKT